MKAKNILLALSLIPLAAAGAGKNPALIDVETGVSSPAPAALELGSYLDWATPLLQEGGRDGVSAFTPKIFEWYERERNTGLPAQVYQDPERIYVNVQGPLAETIELEQASEIEEGNTVGAEVYAEQNGTVREALETMLFRWGKPVGKGEGKTVPPAGNFGKRSDYFAPNADWGSSAFASLTLRRDGGIIKPIYDRYIVLLRGDDQVGYDVVMQYLKPAGPTETKQVFAIALIRPLPGGKSSYKISTRFQGQSYKILGLKMGRSQIGFNEKKVRAIQVESAGLMKELQETGNIHDRKTGIDFGR